MYTPFLLLYDYDFEWKTENFWKYGSHIATGTVYTHYVYTVPATIWLWFWMENWKFLKIWFSYSNGNGVHTFCIHRSCYYMTMILNGKLKIFWKNGSHIATGTVYTHYVYTVPVTIWLWFWMENWQFLKKWFSYSNGNGVHTFCIHFSCYYMTMILNGKLKIFEKMVLI